MPPTTFPMVKFLRALAAALNVLLVFLTLAAVVLALAKPEWAAAAVEWAGTVVRGLGNWNYLVLFATAAVESFPFLGTAVPGQNVMIVTAGFFAPGDIAGSVACAAAGACLGNWLGFALGRAWGPWMVAKYGHWFGLGETEIRWLHKGLETKGFWFIVLGKFHNFFRALAAQFLALQYRGVRPLGGRDGGGGRVGGGQLPAVLALLPIRGAGRPAGVRGVRVVFQAGAGEEVLGGEGGGDRGEGGREVGVA